jgi:hypothetical protein
MVRVSPRYIPCKDVRNDLEAIANIQHDVGAD